MAQRLNKLILVLFVFSAMCLPAQNDPTDRSAEKEYKDGEQFEKFYKRRKMIGAWQINQLKDGALIVKLKANTILINALEKKGDTKLAAEKRLETAGVNVNIMRAFLKNYNFSKVYFIYSQLADTLLKGARENIFLDTNLLVDPKIVMTEKFYLLAENDRIYNSTIGFIPEDSARVVTEKGSPTTSEEFMVIKNKYGHQLKKPFPYSSKIKAGLDKTPEVSYIMLNGFSTPFNVVNLVRRKDAMSFNYNGERMEVFIQKSYLYERLMLTVQMLNENFYTYYQANPIPSRMAPALKPFLY